MNIKRIMAYAGYYVTFGILLILHIYSIEAIKESEYLDKCENVSSEAFYFKRFLPFFTKDYQIVLTTLYVRDKIGLMPHSLTKESKLINENKLIHWYSEFLTIGHEKVKKEYQICVQSMFVFNMLLRTKQKLSMTLKEIMELAFKESVKDVNFKVVAPGKPLAKYLEFNTEYIGNSPNTVIKFLGNAYIINPKLELYKLVYDRKAKNYNVESYIEFLKKLP